MEVPLSDYSLKYVTKTQFGKRRWLSFDVNVTTVVLVKWWMTLVKQRYNAIGARLFGQLDILSSVISSNMRYFINQTRNVSFQQANIVA
jgi:hypothetical protein